MKPKRFLSLLTALCIALSVPFAVSFTTSAAEVETVRVSATSELAETGKDYGLTTNIQDGNILHCFCWKYNDVKAMLSQIAEAGFSTIQVSPPQPTAGTGSWWWFYQPLGFYIGSSEMGNKQELTQLCSEAEKYGIKIIADVVANHLAGDHSNIQNDLKDGQYWHDGSVGDAHDGDRYSVTHGKIGMPDLNTENSYVQQCVKKYVQELKSVGVDGIRWDAAKHIGLPSEGDQFWPTVTGDSGMYHYGEILNNPGITNDESYAMSLLKEYSNYMSITDSGYGYDLREAFHSGNVPSSYGNYVNRGLSADKLVYWGESHDTWSNNQDWGFSNHMSQNTIDRAYAVAASRNQVTALYFSRPYTAVKDDIRIGAKGSTAFTNPEVAAVNKLKNACVGEKDYYDTGDNCAVVCRESGAVIVLGSGSNRSVTVPNGGGTTKPGTYTDLVSGSTWTVTSSTMSGQIGQSGIAVLLNAKPAGPSAAVSPSSKNYTTDILELTLSFENATSGQYSVNGGVYQSFTNGQKITVGKGTDAGTKTTIKVKASNGTQTSEEETYTYNYAELAQDGIYCDTTGTDWSSVNCYIYKDGQGYSQWPGETMQNIGDNIWYLQVPSGYENCQVIFSQGGNNQYPAENGLQYSGSAMIYADGQWQEYLVARNTQATVPSTAASVTALPGSTETLASTTLPTQTVESTEVTQTPTTNNVIVVTPTANNKPSSTASSGNTEVKKYRYGDVDLNDKISIKDATVTQKALAKLINISDLQLVLGDVNCDGKVNVKDVTTIQKYCANIITFFKSGEWYSIYTDAPKTEATVKTEATKAETDPTEAPTTTFATEPHTTATTTAPVTEATTFIDATTSSTEPISTETTPISTEPDGYIYLKSTWSSVNCHSWPSGGEGTTWPGTPMESLGNGIFRINLPEGHDNIVFNGDGQQTGDIKVEGTGKIWDGAWTDYTAGSTSGGDSSNVQVSSDCVYFRDAAAWGTVYCHSWSSDGEGTSWPGTPMESVGNGLYKITLPQGHTNIVFNAGGDHCQTTDLNAEKGKAYNNSSNQWEEV